MKNNVCPQNLTTQKETSHHFIGIGGIGMSALARILLERGACVTGSDRGASSLIESLKKKGAQIASSHNSAHLKHEMRVVISTDIHPSNPELQEALKRGLPILHRSELLTHLMEGYAPLLIAGSHGKTTTTSLLAHTLLVAGLKPAFAVGGIVQSLGTNGQHGTGPYFVAEADESDGSFLNYRGFGAILTNIDDDHLNYWKTPEALKEGFRSFAMGIRSLDHFLLCGDDPHIRELNLQGVSYGYTQGCEALITEESDDGSFSLHFDGAFFSKIELPLMGVHNTLNAAAVFALLRRIGVQENKIREGFSSFKGVGRRQELKGEYEGRVVYDDYGHHPTEVIATLEAFKTAFPKKRLVVAFQPHRYTRTRDCFEAFAKAFLTADVLVLTDIYSAGEAPIEGISALDLLSLIQNSSHKLSSYHIARPDLSRFLANFLAPDDLLVTMGAGDITAVGNEVLNLLVEGK